MTEWGWSDRWNLCEYIGARTREVSNMFYMAIPLDRMKGEAVIESFPWGLTPGIALMTSRIMAADGLSIDFRLG